MQLVVLVRFLLSSASWICKAWLLYAAQVLKELLRIFLNRQLFILGSIHLIRSYEVIWAHLAVDHVVVRDCVLKIFLFQLQLLID